MPTHLPFIGTVFPAGSMILRSHAGTAKGPDGKPKYDICISMTGAPIIQELPDGRYWSVSWDDLVGMAANAFAIEDEDGPMPDPDPLPGSELQASPAAPSAASA